ncbi:MAG: CHAT domain-containing protein [Acidobacteriota bacterium]|nr:CHAT domain-containing protein [Acidobacteriota bacterium]
MERADTLSEAGQLEEAELVLEELWLTLGGTSCGEGAELQDQWRCFRVLDELTRLAVRRGRFEAARSWNSRALSLGKRVKPALGELLALRWQVDIARKDGDLEVVERVVDRAFTLAEQEIGGAAGGFTWLMAGLIAYVAERPARAIPAFDRGIQVLGGIGMEEEATQARLVLSLVYQQLNADPAASLHRQDFLDDAGKARDKRIQDVAQFLEAMAQWERQPASEWDVDRLSSELSNISGLPMDEFRPVFEMLRHLEDGTRRPQNALSNEELDDLAYKVQQGLTEYSLAEAMESLLSAKRLVDNDQLRQAAEVLEQNLQSPGTYGNEPWFAIQLRLLSNLYWHIGEKEKALRARERLLDRAEELWVHAGADELRRSWIGKFDDDYRFLVERLRESDQSRAAFAVTERARGRSLLELLTREREPGEGQISSTSLRQEWSVLRTRLSKLEDEAELSGEESDELKKVRSQVAEALVRLRLARDEPQARTSRSGLPAPIAVADLQGYLAQDTSLVSFYVGEGKVLAWVVRSDHFSLIETQLGRDQLDLVGRFRQAILAEVGMQGLRAVAPVPIEDGAEQATRSQLGKELFRRLIEPLRPHLRGQNLLLIPHEALHFLPFAALQNPSTGKYLVEDFVLSSLPSASILPVLQGRENLSDEQSNVLIVGDPRPANPRLTPLRGAAQEAREVAELWGSEPLVGVDATETEVRRRIVDSDLMHLAAHAVYRADDPLFSYLALTPGGLHDGRLEMIEVFDELNLARAPSIVLSGCETGLGMRSGGDEVVGLLRAFLTAGARMIIATQWRIADRSSADLMTSFYRSLKGGSSFPEALAEAQRQALQAVETAKPYYWAGYAVTGAFQEH